jgi:hypothetical protein
MSCNLNVIHISLIGYKAYYKEVYMMYLKTDYTEFIKPCYVNLQRVVLTRGYK